MWASKKMRLSKNKYKNLSNGKNSNNSTFLEYGV